MCKFMKERVKRLAELLSENEAMLITSNQNRFYFTGFPSSAGMVVITHGEARLFIDFRYYEKAKKSVDSCSVVMATRAFKQVADFLVLRKIDTLYTETGNISVDELKNLKSAMPKVNVSDDNRFYKEILSMRSVKSETEIQNIKKAQSFTDETFSYILSRIEAGRTEKDIMLDMEFYMRRLGSEGIAFDFIVASGENTSLPHAVPTDRVVQNGDFVTMDFGAVFNGYRSDMTRTVAVGYVSEEQKDVYATVLNAQRAAFDAIKIGAKCCDVDKAARNVIAEAGYGKCFGHALGHSVGIDIHEGPNFSPSCKETVKAGYVITVEPGIYIENKFGVRIEDMAVITPNGSVDITASEHNLIVL